MQITTNKIDSANAKINAAEYKYRGTIDSNIEKIANQLSLKDMLQKFACFP